MGKFLKQEAVRQAAFKQQSPYFSQGARADGLYGKRTYPFCLPADFKQENLFEGIRQPSIDFFTKYGIVWHRAVHHLCSSQICCLNFLFPFYDQPEALRALLLPTFPTIKRMLPIEDDERFVTFEYIGAKNYLGERGKTRTRGANVTSADAAVMFEHENGKRQIILIEWKYTESYSFGDSKAVAKSRTDRTKIYAHLYERNDCPLDKSLVSDFSILFYEPFYQLMRQQFLAHEMELARERQVDVVSVLHISPSHNEDFQRVTSPELKKRFPDDSAIAVWKRLVKPDKRFQSVNTETMFGEFSVQAFPTLKAWQSYLFERYTWLKISL